MKGNVVKNRIFVTIIDFQMDFVLSDAKLPVHGAENIIAPMATFLSRLDENEVEGVLFTYDTHDSEPYAKSEEGGMFPLHCEKGTPGWELVLNQNLVPSSIPVHTMEKSVFDMWAEDDLTISPTIYSRDGFFERLKDSGVDTIAIAGVAADFCVKDAIAGFLKRGFKVIVYRELTAGIEREIDQVIAEEFPGQVEVL